MDRSRVLDAMPLAQLAVAGMESYMDTSSAEVISDITYQRCSPAQAGGQQFGVW